MAKETKEKKEDTRRLVMQFVTVDSEGNRKKVCEETHTPHVYSALARTLAEFKRAWERQSKRVKRMQEIAVPEAILAPEQERRLNYFLRYEVARVALKDLPGTAKSAAHIVRECVKTYVVTEGLVRRALKKHEGMVNRMRVAYYPASLIAYHLWLEEEWHLRGFEDEEPAEPDEQKGETGA